MRLLLVAGLIVAGLLADAHGARAQDSPADSLRSVIVQDETPPETEPIDVRVLAALYAPEEGVYPTAMYLVNESFYPAVWGAAPIAWTATLATSADAKPALRLTLTQVANFGATYALKNLVRRPRPYVALDDVDARDRRHRADRILDPNSFPSGHTSSAFALATSLSASFPEWYVVVPAMTWATAAGVSRAWHGVHYPSDILVGAGIGAGTALLVHALIPEGSDAVAVPFAEPVVVPVFAVRARL